MFDAIEIVSYNLLRGDKYEYKNKTKQGEKKRNWKRGIEERNPKSMGKHSALRAGHSSSHDLGNRSQNDVFSSIRLGGAGFGINSFPPILLSGNANIVGRDLFRNAMAAQLWKNQTTEK